ncbi:exosome complex protein Rrp42 [Candidatus Woesearchaeota archaeon]|nr:exosome complex protein Rrp42 [Candidatus Woesearchaeota archaeon]
MNESRKRHLLRSLDAGLRYDGRDSPTKYRNINIEYGASETAEGSAKVTIGETAVIAGVKLSLEAPYSDTPEDGNLMIGAEFLPIANADFEAGPPSIDSIELARVTDRGIREGHAMDLKTLCLEAGSKVWVVSVDICIMNDAGNLYDAASIATIAALKNTRYPEVKDGVVDYKHLSDKKLELQHIPINVTVLKIGNHFIVDPDLIEQSMLDARLSVNVMEDGNLCALQKGGTMPLTTEEISKMIDIAVEKANELRGLLN